MSATNKPTEVKVGDRVRVLAFPQQPQTIGQIGRVVRITDSRSWPIWIEFESPMFPDSCFQSQELELIPLV